MMTAEFVMFEHRRGGFLFREGSATLNGMDPRLANHGDQN